jgi:asparagine synthase (glutamine-hydrolysing)
VDRIEQRSEKDWSEEIVAKLRESVRYRMVSDVKFGVLLSGGIDSSTNVALMTEQMNRPLETFTVGFEGPEHFNELSYARQIVERYKTNHHEVIINSKDLVDFLPKLVFHQDEPIVDPVCVPVYYVSKLARDNGTTVCQVGEGADELFCGYHYWGLMLEATPWAKAARAVPGFARRAAFQGVNALFRRPGRGLRQLDVLRRVSAGQPLFWGGAEAYQETMKERLLSTRFRHSLGGYSSAIPVGSILDDFKNDAPAGVDELHWMSYLDLRLRLPELLLMRVDKMTMASSVEARVPFLDQEVVRLAMSIPQSVKFKDGALKAILKKAVAPLLPADIVHRPKQGFAVPVEDWFQAKLRRWSTRRSSPSLGGPIISMRTSWRNTCPTRRAK